MKTTLTILFCIIIWNIQAQDIGDKYPQSSDLKKRELRDSYEVLTIKDSLKVIYSVNRSTNIVVGIDYKYIDPKVAVKALYELTEGMNELGYGVWYDNKYLVMFRNLEIVIRDASIIRNSRVSRSSSKE
jgi:hypothetical protein